MSDTSCIFCKIANGEIPSATIYEDDNFRVILDLGTCFGNALILLPKEHYANVYEIPEEMAAKAFILAKHMAEKMKEKLGCSGVNILQNKWDCCRSDSISLPYASDSAV